MGPMNKNRTLSIFFLGFFALGFTLMPCQGSLNAIEKVTLQNWLRNEKVEEIAVSKRTSIVLEKGLSALDSPVIKNHGLTASTSLSSREGNHQLEKTLQKDENSFLAGLDQSLMLKIQSFGISIEQLMAITSDGDTVPTKGIILNTMPKMGRKTLAQVRSLLANSQYQAYLLAEFFSQKSPDKIAVLKSDDEFHYLSIVQTNGNNYGITHSQVIKRYRQWKKKYGLTLIGAGNDWLEAEFRNPPADWLAFAREVYEFCPDVVDQGTETISSLAEEMHKSNRLYLWWD